MTSLRTRMIGIASLSYFLGGLFVLFATAENSTVLKMIVLASLIIIWTVGFVIFALTVREQQ